MTDIQKVTIALARPRGNFEGRVETGHYTVNDGTVTLVEPNGVPVDKFKLSRKLKPGEDVRGVACAPTRQRYSKRGSGDFNRKLIYPKVGFLFACRLFPQRGGQCRWFIMAGGIAFVPNPCRTSQRHRMCPTDR